MRPKPAQLHALTSLRFFAAAAIVLFHLRGTLIPTFPGSYLALGVSFFFVLSGFILTYVYGERPNVRAYLLSRLARLWPVHIATLVLTVWLLQPGTIGNPQWIAPFLLNAALLHSWVPISGVVFSFNAVSWSISTELAFYLLFPLVVGVQFRSWLAFFVVLTVTIILTMEYANIALSRAELWQISSMHIANQHPLLRVCEFLTGVGFCKLFLRHVSGGVVGSAVRGTAREIAAIALVMGFAAVSIPLQRFASTELSLPVLGAWASQSAGMVLFGFAVMVFAQERGALSTLLKWRPLVLLGEISFATYMLHQIVIRYALRADWTSLLGTEVALVVVLGATYAGSYVLWRWVEMPGRRILQSLGTRAFGAGSSRTASGQQGTAGASPRPEPAAQ